MAFKRNTELFSTYPEGSQDDSGDLLLDRLLEDVGQGWHHVVASQLLTELRTEGQEPNTEDHLVLELEATLVAQHRCDAETEEEKIIWIKQKKGKVLWRTSSSTTCVLIEELSEQRAYMLLLHYLW